MKTTNITEIKSTIIGTLLILAGLAMIIFGEYSAREYNVYVASGLIVTGILLLFAADSFINISLQALSGAAAFLNTWVSNKATKLPKNDNNAGKSESEVP